MEREDLYIILLFFIIIFVVFLSNHQIKKFIPILETCNDDFNMINKCGCIPCTWKYAEQYNKIVCIDFNEVKANEQKN